MTLSAKFKARKPRYCDACGALAISPGDEYFREAVAHDGSVYVWITCNPCRAITQAVFAWVANADEGVGIEEYREWAAEAVASGDPLAVQARAYLDRSRAKTSMDVTA